MMVLISTIVFCTIIIASCMSALHKDLTDIKEGVDNLLIGYYMINFDFEEDEK